MCLVTVPTLSSAAIINVLSEQLAVNLQAVDQSYTYTGSAFTAPDFHLVDSEVMLPNYNPYEPAPAYFSSRFWWDADPTDNGFRFRGDANTDRWVPPDSGDYDPDANVYASSVVSFNMLFTVEGVGARVYTDMIYRRSNCAMTIMDLTTGTLFSWGKFDLLSGHQYHASAWARSTNGSGSEQMFWLDFLDVQVNVQKPKFMALNTLEASPMVRNVPEPGTMVLMVAGLAGLGFAGGKRRRIESLEVIS